MDFKEELKTKTKYIDNILETYLPKEEGFQKTVIEAMNYSVRAGGKRLRPMLMMEMYELLAYDNNYNYQALEAFMAAMEMIHTYSLVHDDLPAIDNDDIRRGMPTTHAKYGEAMGIFAGDGLLNYAYEVAISAFNESNDFGCVLQAFRILASRSGIYGMLGGQCVDVESTDKVIDTDKLEFIYKLKTSALIEASMMIGAALAGVNEQTLNLVESIASDIGLAFQIQDDILDVTKTSDELGKTANSDEKNNKTTYVSIYGVEMAKQYVEFYMDRAAQNIKELDGYNSFLNNLMEHLISREK